MFWFFAAVLVVVVLAALLWPLIRGRTDPVAGRAAYDVAIYRDQLLEIDRDLARGLLDETEAEAARNEIRRRTLAASDHAETEAVATAATGIRQRAALTAIAVLVPLGAMATYMTLGAPGMPDQPFAQRQAQAPDDGHVGDTDRMVDRLARHLVENPGDVDGWLLLARSYGTQNRFGDASRAYERAIDAGARSPRIRAEYGESLVMAAGGSIPETTVEIFRSVLVDDPTEPRSRFFLGLYHVQNDDLSGALREWVDLRAVTPPGASWLAEVETRIQAAAAALGIDPTTLAPSPDVSGIAGATPAPATALPAPSKGDLEAAAEMSAEDREAMVRGMVDGLAARLEAEPDDRQGWLRLARAYEVLGETEKAVEARARAAALE